MRIQLTAVAAVVAMVLLAAPSQGRKLDVEDDPRLGDREELAAVVLVEFAHYRCPYCAWSNEEVVPWVGMDYVKPGKVDLLFKDLPFTPDAELAAVAAHCAGEQGEFWEYHDRLFARHDAFTADDLGAFARELELDGETFDGCLDKARALGGIRSDQRDAESLGIQGTPAWVLGRRLEKKPHKIEVLEVIPGAIPYFELRKKLDAVLGSD